MAAAIAALRPCTSAGSGPGQPSRMRPPGPGVHAVGQPGWLLHLHPPPLPPQATPAASGLTQQGCPQGNPGGPALAVHPSTPTRTAHAAGHGSPASCAPAAPGRHGGTAQIPCPSLGTPQPTCGSPTSVRVGGAGGQAVGCCAHWGRHPRRAGARRQCPATCAPAHAGSAAGVPSAAPAGSSPRHRRRQPAGSALQSSPSMPPAGTRACRRSGRLERARCGQARVQCSAATIVYIPSRRGRRRAQRGRLVATTMHVPAGSCWRVAGPPAAARAVCNAQGLTACGRPSTPAPT